MEQSEADDDPAVERSFAARLLTLHSVFPTEVPCPTPTKPAASMGRLPSESAPKTPSAALHRTALADSLYSQHLTQLQGLHPSRRSRARDAGSLPPGAYLPRPDHRDRHYQITDEPLRPVAAPVPKEFRLLQPTPTPHPSVSMSESDAQEFEVLLRRLERSLNTLEWFQGGVAHLTAMAEQQVSTMHAATLQYLDLLSRRAQQLGVDLEAPPFPPPPTKTLTDARSLLDSASRAHEAATRLSLSALHNWVLRRRDSQLDKCFAQVDKPQRTLLRNFSFSASTLFDPSTCQQAFQDYSHRRDQGQTTRILQTISRSQSAPSRPSSSATTAQQSSRPPFRGSDRRQQAASTGSQQPRQRAPERTRRQSPDTRPDNRARRPPRRQQRGKDNQGRR